ncbi:hypothetical protein HK100_010445, partial [Physocladia obscura]
MSRQVFTPSNQQRLTNVSVVRLKKGGLRFELACYKNKVVEWRQQIETDIDEVLQTHTIYTNVSKGQTAATEDLRKAFVGLLSGGGGGGGGEAKAGAVTSGGKKGKKNKNDREAGGELDEAAFGEAIVREILQKGELQVADKERAALSSATAREIATLVSLKCVDAVSQRPFPVSLVEKALHEAHFQVHAARPAKQQALDAIRLLQQQRLLNIQRAHMRLRVQVPLSSLSTPQQQTEHSTLPHSHTLPLHNTLASKQTFLLDSLASFLASTVQVDVDPIDNVLELLCSVDPGNYPALVDL